MEQMKNQPDRQPVISEQQIQQMQQLASGMQYGTIKLVFQDAG